MKKWYQSKVFWFNLLGLLTSIFGEVTKIIPLSPTVITYFTLIMTVGNILLRFFTEVPIESPLNSATAIKNAETIEKANP